jgi:hypothetical protein
MQLSNFSIFQFEDEKLLTQDHQKRSQALTRKHRKELLKSEKNNDSAILKDRMLLRHGTELINLSQFHLNLWLDLIERQKTSLPKLW